MKYTFNKITFFSVVLGIFFAASIHAGDELPEIKQITTHPGPDFSPSVSPDGRWLAFTSQRSGNLDIWIKPLPQGEAVQVTFDPAEDFQPTWSPDGHHLAFVSRRRDAQGDIWLVALNLKKRGKVKSSPRQFTHYLGMDVKPCFSPDGNKIVFTSDRNGKLNLWILETSSGKVYQLTSRGGTDPSWSPKSNWIIFTSFRDDPGGDLFLINSENPELEDLDQRSVYQVTRGKSLDGGPAWSPDGSEIVFRRIGSDTNHDGRITPEDNSSIWQKKLSETSTILPSKILVGKDEIKITGEIYKDTEPCWSPDEKIIFTSFRGGDMDCWSIPAGGIFPKTGSAAEQYRLVQNRFGEAETEEALFQAAIGYLRVRDYFPDDSVWVARALVQAGETYHILRKDKRAKRIFLEVVNDYQSCRREVALAELKIAALANNSPEVRIKQCKRIIKLFSDQVSIAAETWLILGDVYKSLGNMGESLTAYNRILNFFPSLRNLRAQAQLKIGDLLKQEGQIETARQAYLSVLKEYGDVPLWRKRAGDRLLNMVQGSSTDKIRGYQQIIQEVSDLPSMVAEAQLAIGETLFKKDQYQQAIRELERVEEMVPTLTWAHAESEILQARIYQEMGDELKGIFLLKDVIDSYRSLEGGRFVLQAREALFKLLFRSAERLKAAGDFALAESRYRKALELRPNDIRLHRGLVEAVARRGKLEGVIREYRKKLQEEPQNPVLLYGLGLALSYWGEGRPKILEQSNSFLSKALAENYRLIYPYLTLSFNYELLEKLAEDRARKKPGFFLRTGKTVTAPLRWMFGFLPFMKRKEKKEAYYEKAIQALITAMSLNSAEVDSHIKALLAQNLANNFYNLGEFGYQKAYKYYRLRLSLDTTFTQPFEKAIFYERMGHCGLVVEDTKNSEKYFRKTIQIYTDLGREEDVQRNMKMLAFLYHLAGRYENAISTYEKIAAVDERKGKWNETERDYRNIAYNYYLMGEPEDCLKYAFKAENILKKRRIPVSPPQKSSLRIGIFGFSIPVWRMEEIGGASAEGFSLAEEAALVYGLISRSFEDVKQYHKAIEYQFKRLKIFQKRKDRLAERITLNRLGTLFYKSYDFGKAWNYFYSSWEKCKNKKDRTGQLINAINLGNVATVELSLLGEKIYSLKAVDCLKEELERSTPVDISSREKLALLNTIGTLWVLLAREENSEGKDISKNIEETLSRMKKLGRAESLFQKGLSLSKEKGFFKEEGIFLKNLSEVAELSGDVKLAYNYLQKSQGVFKKKGRNEFLWRVFYSTANLLNRNKICDSTGVEIDPLPLYRKAMDYLESLPVQEEGSEERLSDRKERWNLYVDAAFAMADRGMVNEALNTVERGRETEVADFLARHPPQWRRERHKIAWGNIRYLRSKLEEINRKITEEQQQGNRVFFLSRLKKEKRKYEGEYTALLEKMRREDDVLAYFSGAESFDLKEFQSLLPMDGAAFCYLMDTNKTLLWAVTKDTISLMALHVGSSFLHSKVEEFLNKIEKDSSAKRISCELYNILVKPVESFINRSKQIIIVPDRFLWNLPFGALSNGKEFFANRTILYYAPSLTVYKLSWQRRKINHETGIVVGDVGDEIFLDSMKRASKKGTTLLRYQATEEAFRKALESADIVDVERWVVANDNDPLTSAIVLYSSKNNDGFLHLSELFPWDFKASIFFLPPRSEARKWEWRSSLFFTYGLLYAGVPSVVNSMWHMAKETKKKFLDLFYTNLNAFSVSEALAKAQSVIMKEFPEPKAWAGFQLIGFGGMNPEERIYFARENLLSAVKKGWAFEKRGEYRDAVRWLERGHDMAETMRDSVLISKIDNEIVRVSVKGKLWTKAIFYQNRIKETARARGDIENVRTSTKNLVVFYTKEEEFDKAAQEEIEYIELVKKNGKEEEVASSCESLAFIYAMDHKYREAVNWAEKAFQLYEKRNDIFGQGKALIRKGRFELEGENYWIAYNDLSKGISLLEQTLKLAQYPGKVKIELASANQLLGLTCEKLTRYDEAMKFQKKGLALFKDLKLSTQIALGYQYLANLYWKTGDYRKALFYQKKAMDGFKSLNNKKLLAMAYSTQGLINMSLGDLSGARKAEQKALYLAEEINARVDQATILKNVGLVAIQEGNFSDAYHSFRRASFIDSTFGTRRGLAYDYRNIGVLLVHLGRTAEAIPILKKALNISVSIGDKRNELQSLYGLGKAYNRVGNLKKALALLDSGVVKASNLLVPELLWRFYRQRAGVLANMGHDKESLADYRKAVKIVEGLRAELKIEAFKQGFLDNKIDLYVDVVRHLLKMKQLEEAFNFVERSKSRNFIDLLGNQALVLPKAEGKLMEQERKARLALQEAESRLAALSRENRAPSAKREKEKRYWETELNKRRKAYKRILILIQERNPELASFVSVNPWSLEEIQNILPDSTALLEYFLTPEELFLWSVSADKVMGRRVKIKEEKIRTTVRLFREAIEAYLSSDAEAHKLYQWLLQPVAGELLNIRHIILVPHGVLHYLPFAALKDENGKYLLEKFSLSIVPSATVLGYCMEKEEKIREEHMKRKILALSNPFLGSSVYNLPFAAKEVKSLQRTYGTKNVKAFFGKKATESVVRRLAGYYNLIHFACHAVYEPEAPLFSALLLTPAGTDDGRLEAHEIFSLKLNSDLVTLSGCETGLAQITRGDEIVGLARSFIFAGTPSILTSLWKVDDLATAVMIKRFYRYLKAGFSKALALRKAQLLVKEKVNSHPAAWAAFELTGDFR